MALELTSVRSSHSWTHGVFVAADAEHIRKLHYGDLNPALPLGLTRERAEGLHTLVYDSSHESFSFTL